MSLLLLCFFVCLLFDIISNLQKDCKNSTKNPPFTEIYQELTLPGSSSSPPPLPPPHGSSWSPVPRSASWPGFWNSTVSDLSDDTSSVLPHSGGRTWFLFGFDVSCGIWLSANPGSVFREATCWVSAAPKVAIDQWFLASEAAPCPCPGEGNVRNGKAPRARCRGWTPANLGFTCLTWPSPLMQLSLFPLLERRQKLSLIDSETLTGGQLPMPPWHPVILSLIIVILYVDFIKSVITLLCSHKKEIRRKRNFNIHGLILLNHIFFSFFHILIFSNEGKFKHIKASESWITNPQVTVITSVSPTSASHTAARISIEATSCIT